MWEQEGTNSADMWAAAAAGGAAAGASDAAAPATPSWEPAATTDMNAAARGDAFSQFAEGAAQSSAVPEGPKTKETTLDEGTAQGLYLGLNGGMSQSEKALLFGKTGPNDPKPDYTPPATLNEYPRR